MIISLSLVFRVRIRPDRLDSVLIILIIALIILIITEIRFARNKSVKPGV